MQTKIISGHHTKMVKAFNSDTLYVLDKDADITFSVEANEFAVGIAGLPPALDAVVTHRNFLIEGDISISGGNSIGVAVGSNNSDGGGKLTVAKSASITTSATAILATADHERIVNQGKLMSGTGIEFTGHGVSVQNDGAISGSDTGIDAGFHGGRIVNNGSIASAHNGIWALVDGTSELRIVNNGTINSDGYGIGLSNLAGAKSVVVNHGSITGTDYAIIGNFSSATEMVRNTGTISGRVWLGNGNDIYDGRGGTATDVSGGADNDLYIVTDTATNMYEMTSEGTDTVKASVNWTLAGNFENLTLFGHDGLTGKGNGAANTLRGNAGSNILFGLDGSDLLNGGKGDDSLYGGFQADTFAFSKGSGHDQIMDFANGLDTIDLRGMDAIDSFADIQAAAKQVGSNVVMTFAGGETLTVANLSLVAMTQDDFMF